MASIGANLWHYNLCRVVVVDVTDDYRVMQPPLPSVCYPVLAEIWVPVVHLPERVGDLRLVDGYLYDWHECSEAEDGHWVVGVVDRAFVGMKPSRTKLMAMKAEHQGATPKPPASFSAQTPTTQSPSR